MPPKKDARKKKPTGGGVGGECQPGGDAARGEFATIGMATAAEPQKSVKKEAMTTKEAVDDVSERFAHIGISVGLPVMAEKMAAGKAGAPVQVVTNVYQMQLPKIAVYRYDVEIIAMTPKDKEVELTKRSRNDYTAIERKRKCLQVFGHVTKEPMFSGIKVYYDGQKQLYSLQQLKLGDGKRVFQVNPVTTRIDIGDFKSVEFRLCQVTEDFQLTLDDLSIISRNLQDRDQSLLQFLNIATSQFAISNPQLHVTFQKGQSYLMDPASAGFREEDYPILEEAKYVAIGAHKSAMAVEGASGRGARRVAVAIDTAKTAFHSESISVIDKVAAIIPGVFTDRKPTLNRTDIEALSQQLKGVTVEVNIGDKRLQVFTIRSVTAMTPREKRFEVDGKVTTVEAHFRTKYNYGIKYSSAPLLVCRKGDHDAFFPMEVCYVLENQRVQQHQQTPKQLKGMRSACIIAPAKRLDQNVKNAAALGLHDPQNMWLAGARINVDKRPLELNARVLPPPSVGYRQATVPVDTVRMWSLGNNHYIDPQRLDRWGIFLVTTGTRDRFTMGDLQTFVQTMQTVGRSHGMEIAAPLLHAQITADPNSLQRKFAEAQSKKCRLLFFVQSDFSSLHGEIKCLEREYQIVTQDMKLSVASSVVFKRQMQTMENVVSKTNVKLGGQNYEIVVPGKWLPATRLFIGVAMSHPAPGTRIGTIPSVIGYCANTRSTCGFVGDFGCQQAGRTDNLDVLNTFVTNIVNDFKKSRGGHAPQDVVIYRSGVSEGEYKVVLQYEVPLIRKALVRNGCADGVKITLMVVSKMHNVRVFPARVNPRDRPMDQNLKPGTVIDDRLVHPEFPEFYLNSHKALQGTAKVPRYTIVVNEQRFTMDELEAMTYSLCFGHQIVTLSTSTPTPLYVATRYAERGRLLVVQKSLSEEGSADTVNVQEANDTLPYHGTAMGAVRLNA